MSIHLGQSVTLQWAATNANSCTASTTAATGGAFAGAQSVSGTASVAPTAAGNVAYQLTCSGAGGNAMATSPMITVAAPLLSELSNIALIGSTVDPDVATNVQGGNPYGLTIAPATSGLISAGDLIVCNFNDLPMNGVQGAGTTIVGLHPSAGSAPYHIAQSSQLAGCNALALTADDGIAAASYHANTLPLVSSAGVVNNPFASNPYASPWGAAYVPATTTASAALYISNVGSGGGSASIDRISLNGDVQTAFTEIAKGFCGSGMPGAIYAPAGLTYDASIDTLYVVDTSSYSVVAFANVSQIGLDGIVVNGGCGSGTPTPALSFGGPSASSARVIASGGQFNAPISAALLADGDLIVGNGDIDNPPTPNLAFEISPSLGFVGQPIQLDTSGTPGALFGIVASIDANGDQIIYFNDDNTNSVYALTK